MRRYALLLVTMLLAVADPASGCETAQASGKITVSAAHG